MPARVRRKCKICGEPALKAKRVKVESGNVDLFLCLNCDRRRCSGCKHYTGPLIGVLGGTSPPICDNCGSSL